jgi:peroxiredoxin
MLRTVDERGQMMNANRTGPTTRPPLSHGAAAPEIVLPTGEGQTWASCDFRGKPIIVVFYPADWEPVSTDQLRSYNDALPQIRALNAELVGISVDGIWCHQAFAQDLGLRFPLLADSHPRGATARAYGVYRRRDGTSARALFVIDGDGVIRWRYLAHHEVNPGIDGMLTALEALTTHDGRG